MDKVNLKSGSFTIAAAAAFHSEEEYFLFLCVYKAQIL